MTKSAPKTSAGVTPPQFTSADRKPIKLTEVVHPDGRISQYPPSDVWNDWTEWDGKEWPKRVARNYSLVPTLCFNCEAGCGLLAYVDKDTYEVRKFEATLSTLAAADVTVPRDLRLTTKSMTLNEFSIL